VEVGDRWYLRHVPPAHDGTHPVPLVLDLHGYAEGATIQAALSGIGPFGDTKGFVTITPQGLGSVPRWQVGVDTDDTAFIELVLDDAERALCIDEDRVYVTGLSMGAFMTSALACSDADRFAAAAPVAGIRDVEECEPSRAVPVVAFHGTDDQIVAYDGGYGPGVADLPNGSGGTIGPGAVDATSDEPSIQEITATWAGRNGCADGPAADEVAADVTRLSWSCPRSADVELYRVNGGGHSWPGSTLSRSIAQIVGPTTMSVSANEVMWAFFVAHPRHDTAPCTSTPEPGTKQITLGARWYRRHVPDFEGALPLVIDLHGFSEGADRAAAVTDFESLGDEQGFVTVTPQGAGELPAWDLTVTGVDVTFIGDVLDDVERALCIDRRRVYVTGHSMGGFLLSTLACSSLADRVTAWAPVAGARAVPACDGSPSPVLLQHGTADPTVLYTGGLSPDTAALLGLPAAGPSVPELAAAWATRNGCGADRPIESTEGAVTWISHPCDVELRRIEDGGHQWPDEAQDVIWRFFEAHAR
jgi:polyhydroxybutyrate depolymerase